MCDFGDGSYPGQGSKLPPHAGDADQNFVCSFVPGYMLREIADSETAPYYARHAAEATLETTRILLALKPDSSRTVALDTGDVRGHGQSVLADQNKVRRQMHDCRTTNSLPGLLVRQEGQNRTRDRAVNNAYDGFGITFNFFSEIFGRNSIDGNGMTLVGNIHYGPDFNNAFWSKDMQQMIFGDGDGIQFDHLTDSLDVIAHELTHGVTEHTCGFKYLSQSGALNESISDVFACMVEQWHFNRQTAEQGDWLLGQSVLPLNRKGQALRSLKNPGKAYDDLDSTEIRRKDRQVGHMDQYQDLPETEKGDWGGVHINSGIPNHAFYLIALALGGHSWERAGKIWYKTMLSDDTRIKPRSTFKDFAEVTVDVAAKLFDNDVRDIVRQSWKDVGVL